MRVLKPTAKISFVMPVGTPVLQIFLTGWSRDISCSLYRQIFLVKNGEQNDTLHENPRTIMVDGNYCFL